MKAMPRKLISEVPGHGKDPAPRPVAVPRTDKPVDLDELRTQIADIEAEIESMQQARSGLKERLLASEDAVTACLRAYSARPTDQAMESVTLAKADEASARQRMYTTSDSMELRTADLKALQATYDAELKKFVSTKKAELMEKRVKKEATLLKRIHDPLVELLATLHLQGTPVGIVDLESFLLKRFDGLRAEVDARATELIKELEHASK